MTEKEILAKFNMQKDELTEIALSEHSSYRCFQIPFIYNGGSSRLTYDRYLAKFVDIEYPVRSEDGSRVYYKHIEL